MKETASMESVYSCIFIATTYFFPSLIVISCSRILRFVECIWFNGCRLLKGAIGILAEDNTCYVMGSAADENTEVPVFAAGCQKRVRLIVRGKWSTGSLKETLQLRKCKEEMCFGERPNRSTMSYDKDVQEFQAPLSPQKAVPTANKTE
ncbi:hypothetical protein Tco_0530672 [Tanacetum coccineum]